MKNTNRTITDFNIDNLNEEVEESIVKHWEEKAKDLGIPVIPPLPDDINKPHDPNPVVAICGECGLELRFIMGYSCNKNNCPCFINFK